MLKSVRRVSRFCVSLATLVAFAPVASAGNFTVDWTTLVYPNNVATPPAFVLTDQFGFQIDVVFSHAGINTATFALREDTVDLGGIIDIFLPADAAAGLSGFGESTATGTMTFFLPGTTTRVGVNGLQTVVTDIDPSDTNATTDRCDLVTITAENAAGGALVPTLGYVTGAPTGNGTNTVFLIGPSTGPGATGTAANYRTIFTNTAGEIARTNLNIAANQAHCLFYPSATFNSPASANNTAGTMSVTAPNGTSRITVGYDEVVENAYNVTNRDASARGVGVWGAASFTTNNSISLDKQTTATEFVSVGSVIPYTYVVTNNGPLPFRSTQNIQINDDKVGLINCPAIPAAGVAVGGTFTCTANYTVTAADETAGFVTNNATAGIGTTGQAFAARLQSNADAVTVRRRAIVAVQKTTTGGVGGPHQFTATNLSAAVSDITTVTAGTPAPVTPTFITPTNVALPVQITETASTAWVITGVSCNDANAAVTANVNPVATSATRIVSVPAAALRPGARITCSYTNAAAAPQLTLVKDYTPTGVKSVGNTYTYRFTVQNTGNVPISNVQANELAFNGYGTALPTNPGNKALLTDAVPAGDSVAGPGTTVWQTLGPGDTITFSANYTVVQSDIDLNQ
jgi:uncharacterized repeat protein (TIGR01451 family)